jgi:hypothetical protein
MSDILLSWTVLGLVLPILIGVGVGVMRTTPPEFKVARWCFHAAYLILTLRVGWWIVVEQTGGRPMIGILGALLLSMFFGVLWVVATKRVDERQAAFSSSNDREVVEQIQDLKQTQREALVRLVEKGTRARDVYSSLDSVPPTLAWDWENEVCSYLEHTFGSATVFEFKKSTSPFLVNIRPPERSEENHKLYVYLNTRLKRLNEIIEELGE